MQTLPSIDQLVPHSPPMLLLSRVLASDGSSLLAEAVVDARGPFGDGLGVPAWVGIEYMAQAVAAWAGMKSREGGGGPRLGFLLGTRRYHAHVPAFADGMVLNIDVRCELLGDNGLGAFACCIRAGGSALAEAQLSVYEPADAMSYLKESET